MRALRLGMAATVAAMCIAGPAAAAPPVTAWGGDGIQRVGHAENGSFTIAIPTEAPDCAYTVTLRFSLDGPDVGYSVDTSCGRVMSRQRASLDVWSDTLNTSPVWLLSQDHLNSEVGQVVTSACSSCAGESASGTMSAQPGTHYALLINLDFASAPGTYWPLAPTDSGFTSCWDDAATGHPEVAHCRARDWFQKG